MLAGLKTRFLSELLGLYGEAVGSSEYQRLLNRLSPKLQRWFSHESRAPERPEILNLDAVEELLLALEESASNHGNRYEAVVADVVARSIARRAWVFGDTTTRSALIRLIPLVEEFWPFRPPTISVEDTPSGFRITMTLLGHSRCTRLLAFQLLGALNAACHASRPARLEELTTTVDFFGDRARIDVQSRRIDDGLTGIESELPPRRPSARLRSIRPSLAEEVESILGRRPTSYPPPLATAAQPPAPSRPPSSALGMALLRRPSQPAQEAARRSSPSIHSLPAVDIARRTTPPPRPSRPAALPAFDIARRTTPPPRPSPPVSLPDSVTLRYGRPMDKPSAASVRPQPERVEPHSPSTLPPRRGGPSK